MPNMNPHEMLLDMCAKHKDLNTAALATGLLRAVELARTRMNHNDFDTWCEGVVDTILVTE